ncbi:MAG: metallophosphoesterase family protein [Chloroflexota bacterium]
MRLAVLSNVHGNLPAFRAVLDHIEARSEPVDEIVAAGDLVGLGPNPNEVMDLVRERGIEAVRGNYDEAVAFGRPTGVDHLDQQSALTDRRAVAWTRAVLSEQNLELLRNLPRDVRVFPSISGVRVKRDAPDGATEEYRKEFYRRALLGGLFKSHARPVKRVRVVHGSPRALNEFIWPDTAQSILETIARDADADMLVTGHAATGFHTVHQRLHFVGAGAVAGSVAPGVANYTIVTLGSEIEAAFETAEYDPEPYLEASRAIGLPAPEAPRDTLRLV